MELDLDIELRLYAQIGFFVFVWAVCMSMGIDKLKSFLIWAQCITRAPLRHIGAWISEPCI
jgi:hypothetical protein